MTIGQLVPRSGTWIDYLLKLVAAGSVFLVLLRFALGNEDVQSSIAAALGVPEIAQTAKDALALGQSQQQTLNDLNGQIVQFTSAVTEAQKQIASTTGSLSTVATRIDNMTAKLFELDSRQTRSTVAPMDIADPAHIDPVAIGGRTRVTIRFAQNAECGRADHWAIRFRDSAGLSGAFQDLSVNDEDGFGPRFDVAQNSFREYTFTAVLPGDDLFVPGAASGRVIVSGWQLCPEANEARSPSIPFTILKKGSQRNPGGVE